MIFSKHRVMRGCEILLLFYAWLWEWYFLWW